MLSESRNHKMCVTYVKYFILFSVEDVMLLFDRVIKYLSDKNFKSELVRAIIYLNASLKIFGEQIEAKDKDKMNKYQVFNSVYLIKI